MSYIPTILFFTGISAAAGVILTVAGRFFRVNVDNTIEELAEQLPGLNCGACGFANCERYAEAIAAGNAEPNQCKPGGEEAAQKLGKVLGKEVSAPEPEVAFVHCSGNCTEKYDYKGTKSCSASELYYKGKEDCRFGCDGLGDCARVCPENAITIKDGRAVIAHYKCNACGMCASVCPKKIITIQKSKQLVHVRCCSKDSGKVTRSVCSSGCIGCRICEKKCPQKAIIVRDNLAVINNDLCNNCGECASVCPSKCISIRRECEFTSE